MKLTESEPEKYAFTLNKRIRKAARIGRRTRLLDAARCTKDDTRALSLYERQADLRSKTLRLRQEISR